MLRQDGPAGRLRVWTIKAQKNDNKRLVFKSRPIVASGEGGTMATAFAAGLRTREHINIGVWLAG